VAAVLVDHIEPVKQGGDMWDPGNLQPLCNLCHERKSAAEGSRD
jgi:5-methylcytosine-specific restriction protein A